MRVTGKKGKGSKVHVSIDGTYDFTTSTAFWSMQSIGDSAEISDGEYETLKKEAQFFWGKERAYDILSRRDHSEKELLTKLQRYVDIDAAHRVVSRMKELGLVNDEIYAEKYVKQLADYKLFGEKRIRQELYKRGISRDIIEKTILDADIDEMVGLCALIQRKYLNALKDERGQKRTFNALLRQGYQYSDIRRAMNQFIKNNEMDWDDI